MKRSEPLSVDAIIEQMISATGMRPEFERRSIENEWASVVGPHIASYTRRLHVDGRRLHVYCVSAPLKEELSYLVEVLTRQLNEAVGANVIDTIVIH